MSEIDAALSRIMESAGVRPTDEVLAGWANCVSMDPAQAAVLNVKMNYLDGWTAARRSIAAEYDRALSNVPFARPRPRHHNRQVHHVYGVRLPQRDELLKTLQESGSEARTNYPTPIHLRREYSECGPQVGELPVTERLATELLMLPIYPELLPCQVAAVTSELDKFSAGAGRECRGNANLKNPKWQVFQKA
jgi:dTDP-4-amino-4,6-dideoxygalactose transaminase